MAYFKIGENDYSQYVNKLKITTKSKYNSQTNAAGDTVVDYLNKKRTIDVGIIPLDSDIMSQLQTDLNAFSVSVSVRNPETNELEEGISCIIPSSGIEYYTIQIDKVKYKAFTLSFTEL